MTFSQSLGTVCLALSGIGCAYALFAVAALRRFAREPAARTTTYPAVTVLKPLRGAEPGLVDNLASFCAQDYAGPVQILFGVQDPADPAIGVVQRLIADPPDRDCELVLHAQVRGPNLKVGNLVELQEHIRHEIVVLADSDIAVAPDYLSKTVAALNRPGVGLVTYLYRGVAHAGLWSQLASMAIDYQFLPSVLVGLELGLARPCFGSTIALRRETLAAIGGFEAFLDQLADDYAVGEAVRAAGMRVAIPAFVLAHACTERGAADLIRHELRWARTLRAVSPLGYASLIVTHPLPLALLGAYLTGWGTVGAGSVIAALGCRLVLQLQVDHTLHVSFERWWLGPMRDLLSFGVYVASFLVNVVSWRGHRYHVRADGTMTPAKEPKA